MAPPENLRRINEELELHKFALYVRYIHEGFSCYPHEKYVTFVIFQSWRCDTRVCKLHREIKREIHTRFRDPPRFEAYESDSDKSEGPNVI